MVFAISCICAFISSISASRDYANAVSARLGNAKIALPNTTQNKYVLIVLTAYRCWLQRNAKPREPQARPSYVLTSNCFLWHHQKAAEPA
jgi:hypothetical protein